MLAGKSTLSLPALLLQLRGGGAQSGSASRNPRLLQPLLLLLTLHCGLPLKPLPLMPLLLLLLLLRRFFFPVPLIARFLLASLQTSSRIGCTRSRQQL